MKFGIIGKKKPKFQVLMCTVNGREDTFNALTSHIKNIGGSILWAKDNKDVSVGVKRQMLLDECNAEYVAFVDDDDWVSDSYHNSINSRLVENPDSIGFQIWCTFNNGTKDGLADMSNTYADWAESAGNFFCVRTPYHKTPMRLSIAKKIGFKDMRFGEDYDFSKRLKQSGLIKNEAYINETLYYYKYTHEDHNTKYGIK